MAKKEENIARLQVLAKVLEREPDISGSAADISQRVKEWEEEAGTEEPGDETGQVMAGSIEINGATVQSNSYFAPAPGAERLLVKARYTLHVHALAPDSDRPLELVVAGEFARIPAALFSELKAAGLVDEC